MPSTGTATENLCERHFYALPDANYNVLGILNHAGRQVERYSYSPYGQRAVFSHGWSIYDVTGDGAVDAADQAAVANATSSPDSFYDLNADGTVDSADEALVAEAAGNWTAGYTRDAGVRYRTFRSFRDRGSTTGAAFTALCEIGHQGLMHEEDLGVTTTLGPGLIHNRARVLHARLGRFVQRDPMGYVDGMSLYEYVGSAPINRRDPHGLNWTVHRNGERWALAVTSGGDTLRQLAQEIRLSANETDLWLRTVQGSYQIIPDPDTPLGQDCAFEIPNTVYVTKGDVSGRKGWKKGWVSALNFWGSMTINGYMQEMKKRGHFAVYDNATSLPALESYLSSNDIYGWMFFGHGSGGFIVTADNLGADPHVRRHLHHALAFVTLYTCEAGQRDWSNFVSRPSGILRASEFNIYAAFTDWDEVPIVPHDEQEGQ